MPVGALQRSWTEEQESQYNWFPRVQTFALRASNFRYKKILRQLDFRELGHHFFGIYGTQGTKRLFF